ncbi:hypothetical protein M8C21_020314, partial [Ambrosia artemisiifolia]
SRTRGIQLAVGSDAIRLSISNSSNQKSWHPRLPHNLPPRIQSCYTHKDKGMDCGKSPSGVKKMKKKQVKDELDRIKQAEKKKRRLEKALATSAAIISELEKKKQREKEEQRRLDEEGAAIAEAVALQVLIGEDSNDACSQVNYGKQVYRKPSEELGWVMNAHGGSICRWNGYGRGENGSFVRGVEGPYVDEMSAAGLVAARAVSNLQIADDEDINAFVFKRM